MSDDPDTIKNAEKVIFPGVGEASTTMDYLKQRGLDVLIKNLKQPVLGICLGMQLLCTHSAENDTPCIGVIPQQVKRFQAIEKEKVPHMGWNMVYDVKSKLFDSKQEKQYTYFVHSYYVELGQFTIATTDYIQPFSRGCKIF